MLNAHPMWYYGGHSISIFLLIDYCQQGRGQSMLVMGEEGLGHSDLALDALRTQKDTGAV